MKKLVLSLFLMVLINAAAPDVSAQTARKLYYETYMKDADSRAKRDAENAEWNAYFKDLWNRFINWF